MKDSEKKQKGETIKTREKFEVCDDEKKTVDLFTTVCGFSLLWRLTACGSHDPSPELPIPEKHTP